MTVTVPETLFGLPRVLRSDDARSITVFLTIAWRAQTGRVTGALKADLTYLERFFAPTATGRRLRDAIGKLPAIVADRPALLRPELFLSSPGKRGLVTPEGRVLLDLLELHRDEERVVFSADEMVWALRTVADLYRDWSRGRLLEVLGLKESALRLPVIAFNLLTLVNGSVGEERALLMPSEEVAERALSGILSPVLDAFVDVLHATRVRHETFRLRGGWILTETCRHLFQFVTCDNGRIWVKRNCRDLLLARLGRELARSNSRTNESVERAIEALIESYKEARPALASLGLAHERSFATREIRDLLLVEFDKARAGVTQP